MSLSEEERGRNNYTMYDTLYCNAVTEFDLIQSDPDSEEKSKFDWWSKYYYSIGDTRKTQKGYVDQGYDGMAVYNGELEEAFNGFTDLVQTLPLYRSKGELEKSSTEQPVGYFKGSFKAYPIPEDEGSSMPALIFSNIPSSANEPVEVIVRVYIIKVKFVLLHWS